MISSLVNARTMFATSSLAKRFLNGAAWSVLGAVGSSGITLVMWMFVARLLGKEIYGQFVVIQSTLAMVGVFAGFGIGAAATKFAAELKTRDKVRLGHILTLSERAVLVFGLIASSALVLTSEWMASSVLNEIGLSGPLAVAAGVVFFSALDGYQKSVLIGFESMRSFAIGALVGAIVSFPIMLLAANYYGLMGAAAALAFNAFLQTSISRFQMRQELGKFMVEPHAAGCLKEWRVLWHFALPALLAGALVGPAHWVVQALLANTQNGYAQLAVLGIAMQWFNIILFVPNTAGRVVLPMLTDHVAGNDHGNSKKILAFAVGTNALFTIPLAGIVALLSPLIMRLYGVGYVNDYVPLVLAVLTATLVSVQTPIGNLIFATSRMWLGALMNAGWALVYICTAYVFIDKGAIWVVSALALGYVAHTLWVGYFGFKELWKK